MVTDGEEIQGFEPACEQNEIGKLTIPHYACVEIVLMKEFWRPGKGKRLSLLSLILLKVSFGFWEEQKQSGVYLGS